MKKLDEVNKIKDENGEFTYITLGEVIDTNDPHQMGRVRVCCPLFGDSDGDIVETIPWATYVSPLGGTTTTPSRGRGDIKTAGQVAYGMFNVPKVGSRVIVACIDGDPKYRIWMGCIHDQFLPHTMPHGRYSYKSASGNQPEGPFSSSEDKIQPLYDSQTDSFTRVEGDPIIDNTTPSKTPRMNFEFRTRGADVGVAGVAEEFVGKKDCKVSNLPDDVQVANSTDDYINTQGYHQSRVEYKQKSSNTGGVLYDPQVYSWTTPGFHSMSMGDGQDNCRIRFRTTHGHQIILDDTNERVYISVAGGKCWIELDEAGNIDVFAERNLSFHAEKDINFTTEKAFRVKAKEGIHMESDGEMRLHAKTDMHIKSAAAISLHSDSNFNIFVSDGFSMETDFGDINIKSNGAIITEATNDISNLAGGNILLVGAEVHLNSEAAPAAGGVDEAQTKEAFWTSRVPEHEPWARVMTAAATADGDVDNSHTPDLVYNDPNVGKMERSDKIERNTQWHR